MSKSTAPDKPAAEPARAEELPDEAAAALGAAADGAATSELGGRPGARPLPVTAVAGMTALVGAVLIVYGGFMIVAGFAGEPALRSRDAVAGVSFLLLGLGIGWAARGVALRQPWARTPALLTQWLMFGAAYWLHQGGQQLWAAACVVFGLAGTVLLFTPAAHESLSRDVH